MKIGAETLVLGWGRSMTLVRDGVELLTFKGRRVEMRPDERALDYSVDQEIFKIYAAASEWGAVRPQKFDVIRWDGKEYTVQVGHAAGADEDELIKMRVQGGLA